MPELAASAQLTEDEKQELVDNASLAVESQMSELLGNYFATNDLSSDEIAGFADAVLASPCHARRRAAENAGRRHHEDIDEGGHKPWALARRLDRVVGAYGAVGAESRSVQRLAGQ